MMPGFATASRTEARTALGLSCDDLYILSFGGSLGAEYVNDAVVKLAAELVAEPCVKLIHAAGKRDYHRIRADWNKSSAGGCERMTLTDYIYDMPLQMAAADLVISRAGAMSISELAVTGKPTVFIPSPYVAENHQYKNAIALVDRGAAVCVEERTLTEGTLTAQVKSLLGNPTKRRDMSRRIRDFACPDANEQIYAHIAALVKS